MPQKNKKKIDSTANYFEFTNYILKSNLDKFNLCLDKIAILVQNDESIPANLIEEYFGYFYYKDDEDVKIFEENLITVTEDTIRYFSKDRAYQFTGVKEEKHGTAFKIDICIRTIITGYRLNIMNEFSANIKLPDDFETREMLLNYFYDALGRFSESYDTKAKSLFTNYQKVIIAAYITQKLGFKFTLKRFTKKQLFDTAKHFIRKTKS